MQSFHLLLHTPLAQAWGSSLLREFLILLHFLHQFLFRKALISKPVPQLLIILICCTYWVLKWFLIAAHLPKKGCDPWGNYRPSIQISLQAARKTQNLIFGVLVTPVGGQSWQESVLTGFLSPLKDHLAGMSVHTTPVAFKGSPGRIECSQHPCHL